MNTRTRQKCRLLKRHYDLFILHIFNSIPKDEIAYIRKRMKEIMNDGNKTEDSKV